MTAAATGIAGRSGGALSPVALAAAVPHIQSAEAAMASMKPKPGRSGWLQRFSDVDMVR